MRAWRTLSRSSLRRDALRRFTSTPHRQRSTLRILDDAKVDESISAKGWVKHIRKQKTVAFVHLNDGSSATHLQAVLKPEQAVRYLSCSPIKMLRLTAHLGFPLVLQ